MREPPVRMTNAPGTCAVCAASLHHPCDEIKHPCTLVCMMVLLGMLACKSVLAPTCYSHALLLLLDCCCCAGK
jgi:hypothetical protein